MATIESRTSNSIISAACIILGGVAVALHSPGHMTTDTSIQLHEAYSGTQVSWAPPFMSAMLYWLGLGHVATSLFVLFNVMATYGGLYLCAKSDAPEAQYPSWKLLACIALILNPVIFSYTGIVWKDVLLASLCTLSLGCSIRAWRAPSQRTRVVLAICSTLILLPIPMVRQQGVILLPIFLLSSALALARPFSAVRSKASLIAVVYLGALVAYVLLKWIVAASFDSSPDGKDFSVGTQIIKRYDLAGIQAAMGKEGPLARAGAPDEALQAISDHYGADRVDHLGSSQAVASYFDSQSSEQIDRLWMDALRSHPTEYLEHRIAVSSWLLGFHDERSCLPFQVGVEGIDAYLKESGIDQGQELRDRKMFDWNLRFVDTPIWKHWLYVVALSIMLVWTWLRGGRQQRAAQTPWLVGGCIFVASFFPTSIACDFRYLYMIIPLTTGILLGLLSQQNAITSDAMAE